MTVSAGGARTIDVLAIRVTTFVVVAAAPLALAAPVIAWALHWPVVVTTVVAWLVLGPAMGLALINRAALLSNATARSFFDATSDFQLEFDVDSRGQRRLASWNRAAEVFGHYKLERGLTAEEVFAKIATPATDEMGPSIRNTNEPVSVSVTIEIDGVRRMLDTLYIPIKPDGKRVRRFLHSTREVTAARTAEASALETGRLLEALGGVAQIGAWSYSAADSMVEMSAEARAIFGLHDAGLRVPVRSVLGCVHPDDVDWVTARQAQALAKADDFYIHYRLLRPDGEVRHAVACGRRRAGTAGADLIIDGVNIDVTELKLADEALKASEASYRRLAESMTDLVLSMDASGKLTFVNQASVNLLGFQPSELIGRSAFDLAHPDDVEGLAEMHAQWKAAGGQTALPALRQRVRRKDGSYLWVESRPSILRDPVTGEIVGFQDASRDITAQVELEAQLRAARIEAEAGAQAKAEFLANMSHELRTPLTSIIGFAELLARADGLDGEPRRYAKRVHDASRALLDIINDVLDFSKLEAGQVELDRHAFAVRDFIDETAGLVALQAERKGVELVVDLDPTVPARLVGDRARLRQILLNLLGNAVKFTAQGRVHLSASYVADEAAPRFVVAVQDTGPGIPADQLGQLFQRFTQADSSISRRFGGTGLGLAICRNLVELMGGRITVESQMGEGSTFRFEVPAEVADGAEEAETAAANVEGLRAARVLLVDDTDVNRELVRALLSPFDLDIEEAANGHEAVEAALARDFDLILMDVRMPGMDGLDATRAIRAAAKPGRRTPILAMSADILPANITACWEAGMDDHIAKPISPDELIGKLAAWLGPSDADGKQSASA